MELARENYPLGLRCERERTERAAAAGAELDLEPARDAPAAGAFGAALFDARCRLARIWRSAAPANGLGAASLRRLPGICSVVRDGRAPRHHRRRTRGNLRPRARRKRLAAETAARSDCADLARTLAHHAGRASALFRPALPPRRSSARRAARLSPERQSACRALPGRGPRLRRSRVPCRRAAAPEA